MNKQIRWLITEIDRWQAEGIVSPEQAGVLRKRYAAEISNTPWALLVFASAGSIVIGLGVILLFAYNWEDIPKFGKLALILIAVVGAHAGGIHLHRCAGWRQKLGEAFCLLGTMFYGAGIWLIAQIYHIDEHYPNGFLLWSIGALLLAWILQSIPHALLATVLLTIWGNCETFDFQQSTFPAVALLAAIIVPLAWRERSALLLATAVAGIQVLVWGNLISLGNVPWTFSTMLAMAGLTLGLARLLPACRDGTFAKGGAVLTFFGYTTFLVCAYLLGFHKITADLLDWHRPIRHDSFALLAYCWSFFTGALIVWALLAWRSLRMKTIQIQVEDWLCPIGLVYACGISLTGLHEAKWLVAGSFNLIFLCIAVRWMWRGCRDSHLRPTVLGSLMLAAVVFARFFDLFDSLAARGLAFLILGGVFFAEAMYYRKQRQPSGGLS